MANDAKVLLMLSGGPDSATLASFVDRELPPGHKASAVYLRSGHPADAKEIEAANRIVDRFGGRLEIIDIPELLKALLADRLMMHSAASILPLGNAAVLSVMMLCAIKSRAAALYVGFHRGDVEENNDYARPSIDRLESSAAAGRKDAPKIIAPFLNMTKTEVFKMGAAMNVPYALTWSCMRAEAIHCGQCGSCRARRRAFVAAGLVDPTRYAPEPVAMASVGVAAGSVARPSADG
jgi:7-cyano-7-deazaguanine synthase